MSQGYISEVGKDILESIVDMTQFVVYVNDVSTIFTFSIDLSFDYILVGFYMNALTTAKIIKGVMTQTKSSVGSTYLNFLLEGTTITGEFSRGYVATGGCSVIKIKR